MIIMKKLFKQEVMPEAEVKRLLTAYGFEIIKVKNKVIWLSLEDRRGQMISLEDVNTSKKLRKFLIQNGLGDKIPQ